MLSFSGGPTDGLTDTIIIGTASLFKTVIRLLVYIKEKEVHNKTFVRKMCLLMP